MKRLFLLISVIVAVAGFYSINPGAQASTERPTTQASPSAVTYHNVMIPMRDGIRLATDIYIPSNDGGVTPAPGRFPALLMRTPYGKKGRADAPPPAAVSHGYVVVMQDVRGTFSSEGVFEPMLNEGTDGFDTMAWLRKQPWADGRVGTFGGSYLGGDQMLLAAEQPQGLVAAFASVAATDLFNNEWVYMDGVFALDTATKWTSGRVRGFNSRLPKFEQKPLEDDYASLGIANAQSMTPEIVIKLMKSLPLRDAPIVRRAPWWSRWLDNASNPRYFKSTEMVNRFQYINIPILHLGGWYDQFLRNTYEHFKGVSTQAKSSSVRANQRLVIGPWTHGPCDGFPFPNSTVDQEMMQSAWMDSWFKGKKHPFFDYPVVLYVMGENRWRAEESWPLAGIQRTRYYLRGQGSANTANVNGMLSTIAPSSEPSDRFAYDPHNPAPTLGGIGSNIGCRAEQNDAERRPDILVFTSPELTEDIEVTGEVTATLYAASSAKDTDWWVKLVDVAPDGKAYILNHGVVRARYRHSRTQPEPLTPGKIERYEINMWATSNVFKKGHRIRVEVTSSNFPYTDRNPNAFIDLSRATEKDFVMASQTIYHDAEHPSHVELPIIPQARARKWVETPFPRAADMPARR